MELKVFIQEEIKRLDQAVHLAQKALKTTVNLQDVYFEAKSSDDATEEEAFTRDTLKYFDANNAIREMELLQLQLGELKSKLIEAKMENDKLLFAGGYLKIIDESIAHIFLKNTLCKLQAEDHHTPDILEETIEEIQNLKEKLQEIA